MICLLYVIFILTILLTKKGEKMSKIKEKYLAAALAEVNGRKNSSKTGRIDLPDGRAVLLLGKGMYIQPQTSVQKKYAYTNGR